ncbi:MAG: betaine-aldehyde dehydrogenase, partial [Chloroflexi bacterium]|nr:betaine-aldehyde dehydrogenase [Chloroflexota bacterium]
HEAIHEQVLSALTERLRALRIGPGLSDPDLGPLISAKQFQRAIGLVERAVGAGAQLLAGGRRAHVAGHEQGWFLEGTLLANVDADAEIWQEEVFGPVLAATTFRTDDEAVALANSTEYGLVTGIWTRDVSRAHRVPRQIRSGQVYVNTYGAGGGVELPFGGFNRSGYGRGKGQEAMLTFSQVKNVCIAL